MVIYYYGNRIFCRYIFNSGTLAILGEPEWKWFLILILISKLFTEAVRSDFEKNGIEYSNKKLALVAQILQIFVIIRGVQSIFFA